ncbi:acyl-CoA dehydrogenase family protein [Gordonia sp. 'Campus']|uniref:acyl-CoA dehydrogenase family protein n=1 Tax=Gordonia sp. 'Campus' TaxID=2915824 RepID=UPI001EE47E3F|nr:acyl-CoA dehydrogenase family protein [Gordonia sp. 'Campus']
MGPTLTAGKSEVTGVDTVGDVVSSVADRARDLDAGRTDTRVDIAAAGRAGLLDRGVGAHDDHSASVASMVEVIERVSAASLSVGFSLWAQRMVIEYVARAPERLRQQHLRSLVSGDRIGVTAMAAGLKQVAGLGEVPITGHVGPDGLVINGPIRWASNVYDESLIVLPVRTGDTTLVVVVDANAPGVEIRTAPELIGLGSTASTSLALHDVVVGEENVISDDLTSFVRRIRPVFLLLQCSFCSGAIGSALDGAAGSLTGVNEVFRAEFDHRTADFVDIRQRLGDYAVDPSAPSPAELIRLRLDAAQTAAASSRLEATVRGGAGYATGSDTNRRFRETAFIPIQSPSEGQLRWELAQFE